MYRIIGSVIGFAWQWYSGYVNDVTANVLHDNCFNHIMSHNAFESTAGDLCVFHVNAALL